MRWASEFIFLYMKVYLTYPLLLLINRKENTITVLDNDSMGYYIIYDFVKGLLNNKQPRIKIKNYNWLSWQIDLTVSSQQVPNVIVLEIEGQELHFTHKLNIYLPC